MSATLLWAPSQRGTPIPGYTPRLRDALCGAGDVVVDESMVAWLRGYAAAEPQAKEAVDYIIEKITEHGTINLWREF